MASCAFASVFVFSAVVPLVAGCVVAGCVVGVVVVLGFVVCAEAPIEIAHIRNNPRMTFFI